MRMEAYNGISLRLIKGGSQATDSLSAILILRSFSARLLAAWKYTQKLKALSFSVSNAEVTNGLHSMMRCAE